MAHSTSQTLPFENLKQVGSSSRAPGATPWTQRRPRLPARGRPAGGSRGTWAPPGAARPLLPSPTHTHHSTPQIRTLCLSPDGSLLLSIDADGRALVVHRGRRVLLHHVSFKAPVRAAKFSPDGAYVAVGVGKLLQVGPRDRGR